MKSAIMRLIVMRLVAMKLVVIKSAVIKSAVMRSAAIKSAAKSLLYACLFLLTFAPVAKAHDTDPSEQPVTQTFRGRILDAYTEQPLPGAAVVILDTDPLRGTATGIDGYFRLDHLPLGRINVKISMVGFQPVILHNLLVVSGRELVVEVRLEEQVYTMDDIVVRPEVRKDLPRNEMALISARSFTIDETERFAGSLGDPSRMAANYAGVSSAADQRNDIVIRGNSPLGLQWRLEGVDIPNPNHFGSMGSTGGPVSMINNNLLADSDFYTGAFPAEYGNALAGVFDLRLRNGNNLRHEFMGQVGFNGFELGAEGPLSAHQKGSYILHGRYSTLEALKAMGMSFGTGTAVPEYKDLSFKINIPVSRGRFSFFGLGGINHIAMLDSRQDEAQFGFSGTDLYYDNQMGVLGVNYMHFLSRNSRFTTSLSVSGIFGQVEIYELADQLDVPNIVEDLGETRYTGSLKYWHRLDSRNYFNAGLVLDYYDVSYTGRQFTERIDDYIYYINTDGKTTHGRAFVQWQHRFNDEVTLVGGVHASRLFLNDHYAVEPRASVQWQFRPGESLNLGAGMHSQTQMKGVYFSERLTDTLALSYEQTNRHLDFTHSMHLVAGYDRLLGEEHRLKLETYYQRLYRIPVSWRRPEFSLISQGGAFYFVMYDNMENTGTGANMGVELTLERFLRKGFYYLFTASVFDSGYRGYDGVWRNSAFNNNFVFNILAGYEWRVGPRSLLSVDMKVVYAGGYRYLPIDEEASRQYNETRYHWDQAYEKRYPDYFRWNARITYRLNGRSVSQEWALDLQNITNRSNIFTEIWNRDQQEVTTSYQMGFMPMMTWRIHF